MPNSKAVGEASIDTGTSGLNSSLEKATVIKRFYGTD